MKLLPEFTRRYPEATKTAIGAAVLGAEVLVVEVIGHNPPKSALEAAGQWAVFAAGTFAFINGGTHLVAQGLERAETAVDAWFARKFPDSTDNR